jgi:hypothetical protein
MTQIHARVIQQKTHYDEVCLRVHIVMSCVRVFDGNEVCVRVFIVMRFVCVCLLPCGLCVYVNCNAVCVRVFIVMRFVCMCLIV